MGNHGTQSQGPVPTIIAGWQPDTTNYNVIGTSGAFYKERE